MAAGGSRVLDSHRRGATTGQGATIRREGQAPFPPPEVYVPAIDQLATLEDICEWLGTFRERLRLARAEERPSMRAVVVQLEARYQMRRAELS